MDYRSTVLEILHALHADGVPHAHGVRGAYARAWARHLDSRTVADMPTTDDFLRGLLLASLALNAHLLDGGKG